MELMPPPAPNVPGASAQNYSYPDTRNSRINKYSIRADHHFAGSDTLFGRFSWQNTPETFTGTWIGRPGAELNGVAQASRELHHGWQAAIGWVNPIGSNLVTEVNTSIWRFSWLNSRPLERRNWTEELGYDDAHVHNIEYENGRGPANVPILSASGYAAWFGSAEYPLGDWGVGLKYTASWRRGDHYLKFGVEHNRNLETKHFFIPSYSNGGDLYNGFATGQILRNESGAICGASFGEPWADFMLGLPWLVYGNNQGLGA